MSLETHEATRQSASVTDTPTQDELLVPFSTTSRTFDRGAVLALPIESFWTLVEGEVLVQRAGRAVEVWRAPCVLDPSGTVQGTRSARFVAVTHVRVAGTPTERAPASAVSRALAAEAARLWARVETDVCRDDDAFLDGAVPVPGPWWFRRVHAAAIVMQGRAETLSACLPKGVRLMPGTGGRYVLAVTRLDGAGSLDARDGRQFLYHEVTPFLPVWTLRHGPALFVPELYPDAWMAVILGREIHGFPKRTARVAMREDGAELIVGRRLAARLRWRKGAPCTAGDAMGELTRHLTGTPRLARGVRWMVDHASTRDDWSGFDVLVRKRIGEPSTAGATTEIDSLVRVPFRLDAIRDAARLEVTDAEVGLGGGGPGPGILHGHPLAAVTLSTGFRFGAGHVIGTAR